jgi:hypothetical protein
MRFGANIFYYYGAGGGGVAYPDCYYFDLHGTPALEKLILASFKQVLGK